MGEMGEGGETGIYEEGNLDWSQEVGKHSFSTFAVTNIDARNIK
jgi:hypothetical protein